MSIPERSSLGLFMYRTSGPLNRPLPFGAKGGTTHIVTHADHSRGDVTIAPVVIEGITYRELHYTKNPTGDCIYLPYDNNRVFSLRLPGPTPTGGPRFFYTSVMHGCKFFVDGIVGSNDVIVYHANAKEQDPGGGALPNSQNQGCFNKLGELHNKAQKHYMGNTLYPLHEFGKSDYFLCGNGFVSIKQAAVDARVKEYFSLFKSIRQRRIDWMGRCFVCAYPRGSKWEFYYQTWGGASYERPNGLPKKIFAALTGHYRYLIKTFKNPNREILEPTRVIQSGQLPPYKR